MKTLLILIIGTFLSTSLFSQEGQKPNTAQQPPAVRKIPGLTAEDTHPNACVDCHAKRPDRNFDNSLSTIIGRWNTKTDQDIMEKVQGAAPEGVVLKGVHPDASEAFGSIPANCIKCHRSKPNAPRFDGVIHLIHLTGGEKNHYITFFQGECTNCHKLNQTTGRWTIPSNPEK